MNGGEQPVRIGLLWRGDRTLTGLPERAEQRLGPLLAAFRELPVVVEHIVYADDALAEVRDQLMQCHGVLAWVNPIQNGENRAQLDSLLRDSAARGVWVSAHPDTIQKLGTKEVLYHARDLPWGSDVELYPTAADFADRFPRRLASHRNLVVKQARGNGGDGVWKVELATPSTQRGAVPPHERVFVRDARATDGSSTQMQLGQFIPLASECFAWSGSLIDQPFQERLANGMLRCYFTQDQVVGFCRQWPRRGLLGPEDAHAAASRPASVMETADAPAYQALRSDAETTWLPELMTALSLDAQTLPVIWDADFLFGPTTTTGEDTYILCEINTSAVWPFPPSAARTIARAALTASTNTVA